MKKVFDIHVPLKRVVNHDKHMFGVSDETKTLVNEKKSFKRPIPEFKVVKRNLSLVFKNKVQTYYSAIYEPLSVIKEAKIDSRTPS